MGLLWYSYFILLLFGIQTENIDSNNIHIHLYKPKQYVQKYNTYITYKIIKYKLNVLIILTLKIW